MKQTQSMRGVCYGERDSLPTENFPCLSLILLWLDNLSNELAFLKSV